MLKFKDGEGYYYVSDRTQKLYTLHEGMTIGLEQRLTSDMCFIMDSGFKENEYEKWYNDEIDRYEGETFVGFFYGVSSNFEMNADTIKEYVDEYEDRLDL